MRKIRNYTLHTPRGKTRTNMHYNHNRALEAEKSLIGAVASPAFLRQIRTANHWKSPFSLHVLHFISELHSINVWAGISQSVWRLTTGWTFRGFNPGGGEIFRTHPDRPWGPPSLLYNRYRVFPGGKAGGAWRLPPTPSNAEVKGRLELYLHSPSGPSLSVLGWPLPLPFTFIWY